MISGLSEVIQAGVCSGASAWIPHWPVTGQSRSREPRSMSIVLDRLTKRFASQLVVDQVSLEIAEGEFFVLLGASGSGKTSILRMIAGLSIPDAGRVMLHGRDVTSLPPQHRGAGFVFQNYSLFRHMTVAENIEFGLTVRKVSVPERSE